MANDKLIFTLLGVLLESNEEYSKISFSVLHKYLIRIVGYEKFVNLVLKALPRDIFDDFSNALEKAASYASKENDMETAVKILKVGERFKELRKFMRDNEIYPRIATKYPDIEADTFLVEEKNGSTEQH